MSAVALLAEGRAGSEAWGPFRGARGRPKRSSSARPANDRTFRAAAETAIRDPFIVPGTAFKAELAKHTIVQILKTVSGVQS